MLGRRILNEKEKAQVMEHWQYKCYICHGDIIDGEEAEFVHIRPLDEEGTFHLDNYAPLHDYCFLKAGEKELDYARDETRIEKSFSPKFENMFSSKQPETPIHIDREKMTASVDQEVVRLFRCPNTEIYYFYHQIPAIYLEEDPQMPKRTISRPRIVSLAGHLKDHVQFYPVVCRYERGRLFLISGHHRTAAQCLGNENLRVDCKILIGPDVETVLQTRQAVYGKLRAREEKGNPLSLWLKEEYEDELCAWQEMNPDETLTETAFFEEALFMSKTQSQKVLESFFLDWAVKHTHIKDFFSREKSGRPLTQAGILTLIRSLLTVSPLASPWEGAYSCRGEEMENFKFTVDSLVDHALTERWMPEHPSSPKHVTAKTQFSDTGAIIWSDLLASAMGILLYRKPEDGICYGKIFSRREKGQITQLVKKLFDHPFWQDTEVDKAVRSDDQESIKTHLKRWGLNHLYLLRG